MLESFLTNLFLGVKRQKSKMKNIFKKIIEKKRKKTIIREIFFLVMLFFSFPNLTFAAECAGNPVGATCLKQDKCTNGLVDSSLYSDCAGDEICCKPTASSTGSASVNSTATPASGSFQYTLLESLPGFFQAGKVMTDFPALILAIYKFGIWTIGICALFMITNGGGMYLGSAGNTSAATNAKGIIFDALIGVFAAMVAYLFLYVINPDLTTININFTAVNVDVSTFGGEVGVGNPTPASGNCKADAMLAKIKSASQGKLDPCLTFALLNTESGCTANAQSGAGACGIAQLMPATAGVSCETLKSNMDLSISKGVNYLASAISSGKIRGNINGSGYAINQAIKDAYAAYNGGLGCLSASNDCGSSMQNVYGYKYVKWDCPTNSGGYTETVKATARFLDSYNTCKGDQAIQSKLQ